MAALAWLCLLSPLGAVVAITLAGTRITRRGAAYLATASVGISFVAAASTFFDLLGEAPHKRSHPSTLWTWLTAGGRLAHSSTITRSFGSPAEIGRLFLTDHLLAFEITSIVLLVAAIGGVILGSHSRRLAGEKVQ